MGIWGPGIYENDLAQDVKTEYDEMLLSGFSDKDAYANLKAAFSEEPEDEEDSVLFWLALADIQWNYGRLETEVKEAALEIIDNGADLEEWNRDNNPLAAEREKVLLELKDKLMQPQPKRKRLKKEKQFRCSWKTGDVFAYQMHSEKSKELGFYEGYLLLQKVDESVWYPNHTIPIIRIKLCVNRELPKSTEDFNKLPYVQTTFTRYEERFFPIDCSRYEEDIAEKSKLSYPTDEYGFLPQYRMSMITTSERNIPKSLVFLGNFSDAEPPANEFVPHSHFNVHSYKWKELEERVLGCYCRYNLRQSKWYQNKSD